MQSQPTFVRGWFFNPPYVVNNARYARSVAPNGRAKLMTTQLAFAPPPPGEEQLAVALARKRRARALATVGVAVLTGVPLLCVAHQQRGLFRVNETPSEPEGVYVRAAHDPIGVGSIIAFLAPPLAFPYADKRAGYLHETPILKVVAAAGGDNVCTLGGVLAINGVRRAPVQSRDRQGFALPHWTACRRLASDELFVFSNRVPNSFDSRYYGPVRLSRAEAYRPLVTVNGIGR